MAFAAWEKASPGRQQALGIPGGMDVKRLVKWLKTPLPGSEVVEVKLLQEHALLVRVHGDARREEACR